MQGKFLILIFLLFATYVASYDKTPALRLLNSSIDKQIEELCRDGNINFTTNKTNLTVSEYINTLNLNVTGDREFLLNLILKGETTNLGSFIKSIAPYVVMFVFALLSLITLVCLNCCCCWGCGCFNKERPGCCGFFSFIIAVGMFGGIIVLIIISFSQTGDFAKYFAGSTCSFLQFFNHTIFGDTRAMAPRWIGLTGIVQQLANTTKLVENMGNITQGVFDNIEYLKGNDSLYLNDIQTSKNDFYKEITAPNDKEKTILPIYAKEYESEKNITLDLGKINVEYNVVLHPSIELMNSLFKDSQTMSKETKSVVDAISGVTNQINDFSSLMDSMETKISNQFITYISSFSGNILLAFKIIFGIFIAFAIGAIGFLILFLCSHSGFFKFLLHLIWNLLLIFIIAAFIIGSLLGIVGTLSQQVVPVVSYFLDKEYLSSKDSIFGSNSQVATYIDICLNGNGSLAEAMNVTTTKTSVLDTFYNATMKLDNMTESIKALNKSTVLTGIAEKLEVSKNEFVYATDSSYGDSDVTYILNDLRQYTDKSKDESACAYDLWTSQEKNCEGYSLLHPGEQRKEGELYCLLFKDWEETDVQEIYKDCAHNDTILSKFVPMKAFVNAHTERVQSMIDKTNEMSKIYETMGGDVQKQLGAMTEMLRTVIDVFNPILGDYSFFEMFNCGFVKEDLIYFFEMFFFHFAKSSITVGSLCLGCAFISYLGVFFLIEAIYKNSRHGKSKTKE